MLETIKKELDKAQGQTLTPSERAERAVSLAKDLLNLAQLLESSTDAKADRMLHKLIGDPLGKAFTTALADQVFRSKNAKRTVDQVKFIVNQFGIPTYLPLKGQIGLRSFELFGRFFPKQLVSLLQKEVRKEAGRVVIPAEKQILEPFLLKRIQESVRVNLNHIGEAILGENEAETRVKTYLDDLAHSSIDYISIKISTLYSQLSVLGWDSTQHILKERLRALYRLAKQQGKFVNLDMEEYRDLHLTYALFCSVLEEKEFLNFSAGIVLQSYLPDAHSLQIELTKWALERLQKGGAPIKLRIVKGANLAMEKVEASLRNWPQAPYLTKEEVDANFLKMLNYGCESAHARAVHLGIASHNLFDIAYGLLLRVEKGVENWVQFEMLQGMAEGLRKAVQTVSGEVVLYTPVATRNEFQYAIAYLVRRLDENTAPDNFLRYAFGLQVGSKEWNSQVDLFKKSIAKIDSLSFQPRRDQNRLAKPDFPYISAPFENEADTDWSLLPNRQWADQLVKRGSQNALKKPVELDEIQVDSLLRSAVEAQRQWSNQSVEHRSDLLFEVANQLRIHRGNLIEVMMAETHKTMAEADAEVSEAIDFAEYYRRLIKEFYSLEGITWAAKGVVLVAPPWNFPCSIPAGGILAALATGNSVVFKPAPEAVAVGAKLVEIFWQAGIDPTVLQFAPCPDEPVGTRLIQDSRIALVVLTGATETAQHFLCLRPDLDLAAETGGKNTLIITALADRDLAIRDLLQSAFGYAGQKCSACSLAILEKEVYEDPEFKRTLRDAVASLRVGLPWDLSVKVNPLIRAPSSTLLRGLTKLEEGEEWLLQPFQDPEHPHLWTPGIKWGVQPGSFTHQTELFGPVLGVLCADNLTHAIEIANSTRYGLTAGLHSLDEREHLQWIESIEAGNCYINRGITGAIVQRQPFGGCKQSSFGRGLKAGGPNYLLQFMHSTETAADDSYLFFWDHYFSQDHDPSELLGQSNILRYIPHPLTICVQNHDSPSDLARIRQAAALCNTPIDLLPPDHLLSQLRYPRVRFLSVPPSPLLQALAEKGISSYTAPVLANGRLELLHYLRELSLSIETHRYGYLGYEEPAKQGCGTSCSSCACH